MLMDVRRLRSSVIKRLLDRLELVLKLIDEVEATRDAVLKKVAPADDAERMIRSLANVRSIGPDFATLLVRKAFVREFRNRSALGGYVESEEHHSPAGGSEREHWLYLTVVFDLFGVKLAYDSSDQARRASGPLAFFQASMPP
jgi:hypothetical protein